MVATGLTRHIDDLGRIMIPKAIRRRHEIFEKDTVEIFKNEEGFVVIKKYDASSAQVKPKYHTDNVGRIVLPKSLRRDCDLKENDYIEIFTEGDCILLKKYETACVICGERNDLISIKDKKLCMGCVEEICAVKKETASL